MWSKSCEVLNPAEALSAPAIPGPEDSDPNILELCFRNGEAHMKEKIIAQLRSVAGSVPCITLVQAIKMVEEL